MNYFSRKNNFFGFFCSIFLILLCACNPIEAITDTYADIVEEVSSDDNNDDTAVGQVIAQAAFTSPNSVTVTVAVTNKLGNLIRDNTEVNCSFFSIDDGFVNLEFTEPTVSGQTTCTFTNGGVAETFTFTATSEGVSSNTLTFTLGPSTA